MSTTRFAARCVLITGAASGLGRATALHFSGEGARIYAVDRNVEGAAETVELVRRAGGQADWSMCDVTEADSVRENIERAAGTLGAIHILINAAGLGRAARFEEIEIDEWRRVMAVNLDGPFLTMKAALPHLLANPGSNIVNVASVAAMRGQAYHAHYSASKAGLLNLTRSVALEFASRGLRANCICPGGVMTPFIRNFIPRPDFEPSLVAYYSPPVPHKLASPADVAKVIAFLASDDAAHINGSALIADDGTLA